MFDQEIVKQGVYTLVAAALFPTKYTDTWYPVSLYFVRNGHISKSAQKVTDVSEGVMLTVKMCGQLSVIEPDDKYIAQCNIHDDTEQSHY